MQPNTIANKWIKTSVLICAFTYLFIIVRKLHLRDFSDDQYFISIFNSNHIIQILVERYFTWTGRFPIELLMTTTISFKAFWKIGVPLAVIVLCFSLSRIVNKKVSVISFAITLGLFATIPNNINTDASWWITGFYNYLLPVTLAIYSFSVTYTNSNKPIEKAFCFIAVFYFSYMEQAGIAYVIAISCILLSNKESRSKFNITILTISIINLAICLKAPGNEQRLLLEPWNWYPQYTTYGLINKLSLGFDKLHQLMTFRCNIPLIGLVAAIIALRSVGGKMLLSIKIAMVVMMTFIALSITNSLTGFFSNISFFYSTTLDASNWSSEKIFLSYLYLFIVISSLFIIMLDMLINKMISTLPIIAMFLGFMTVTMLGMSPTVYASGFRVDFVFEIMCILSCMYIFKKLFILRSNAIESPMQHNAAVES
ncbi:DUF6056 family protein [Pantoea phytobeneficialis]|uniref:Uncharacterized protein n=1 Tax=Pantoea phytobeneficialis TaxID=2052056 RepID=A0AAP9H6X1_9GAMM|nr:DUF6056 family protein [Pantoea phytobeneficialis]MDO6405282.1 hypothetical protein [Pantoea phytobeneficialis]QGR07803.1 hypothetical protein CTZ24_15790 [Pantoea phytobeneficialis]